MGIHRARSDEASYWPLLFEIDWACPQIVEGQRLSGIMGVWM